MEREEFAMLPIGDPDAIADALLKQDLVPEMPVDLTSLIGDDEDVITSPNDGADAFDTAGGAGPE